MGAGNAFRIFQGTANPNARFGLLLIKIVNASRRAFASATPSASNNALSAAVGAAKYLCDQKPNPEKAESSFAGCRL